MLLELVMAIGIIVAVLIVVAYGFYHEQRVCRAYYYRAVAMETVDGEMEILAAGEWKTYAKGAHVYKPRSEAVSNLPAGAFVLDIKDKTVRLEWMTTGAGKGGSVVREVSIR